MVSCFNLSVHSFLVGLCIVTSVTSAHAANVRWSASSGTFHTPANWSGGLIPNVIDVAQFGRTLPVFPFQQIYTVSFNNNATNQALHIEDDQVTFDLNSRTYTVTAATGIVVGNQSNGHFGRLTVLDGSINSGSTNIDVGAAASTQGTLIVGANGLISGAANFNIGKLGGGTLTVQANGDIVTTGATTVGAGSGVSGTAAISGDGTVGSATLLTGALNVGSTGAGIVNVQLGGLLQNSGAANVGGNNGTLNVMHLGSVWNSQGLLRVGNGGEGEVNVTLGGKLTSVDATIGSAASGSGEVNIEGASSVWENSGSLTVGGLGAGTLTISGGGKVLNDVSFLNHVGLDGTGVVTVTGAGSIWETNRVFIGGGGDGTVNIINGGTVHMLDEGLVGNEPGFSGAVAVSGVNSLWETTEDLLIGVSGEGELNISSGGRVKTVEATIGRDQVATGHVTVDGASSVWEYSGNQTSGETDADLIVGDLGDGRLEITGGGRVLSTATSGTVFNEIGTESGSTGLVRVSGQGSLWNAGGRITVGGNGQAALEIIDGGAVGVGQLHTGNSLSSVTVSGIDSIGFFGELSIGRGRLSVADGGQVESQDLSMNDGALEITSGGIVQTFGSAFVGNTILAEASVMLDGANSFWGISGDLQIGSFSGAGNGSVSIKSGASLICSTIQISLDSVLSLEGGTLRTSEISFVDNATADSAFNWTSGTLEVETFNGDLVNQAGILAPIGISIGQATVLGDYNQFAGATLQLGVQGTTSRDFLLVADQAFLDGALDIALVGGFVPTPADTIAVLNAQDGLFGAFDNVANGQRLTTSDGSGSFIVNYGAGSVFNPNAVVLSNFLSGFSADFDEDGDVDATDLAIWRGAYDLNQLGDADGDNDSDGRDFLIWQRQFGAAPFSAISASIAVPEPASLIAICVALLNCLALRPGRRV